MKKAVKNLLVGVGVAALGFIGYALWDAYTTEQARLRKEAEAERAMAFRKAYIERRRAYAKARAAAEATNEMAAAQSAVADPVGGLPDVRSNALETENVEISEDTAP